MTADITPEAVAKMLDGVTDGPWVYDPLCPFNAYSDDATGYIVATVDGFRYAPRPEAEKIANARFFAWARESVPALAAERDTLRVQLDSTLKDRARIIAERDRTFALMLARAETAEAENARLRDANTSYQEALQRAGIDGAKGLDK